MVYKQHFGEHPKHHPDPGRNSGEHSVVVGALFALQFAGGLYDVHRVRAADLIIWHNKYHKLNYYDSNFCWPHRDIPEQPADLPKLAEHQPNCPVILPDMRRNYVHERNSNDNPVEAAGQQHEFGNRFDFERHLRLRIG